MRHIVAALLMSALLLPLAALERRPPEKIDLDQLTDETLLDASHSKDHIAFVWYIPTEYWNAVISQNPEMSQVEKMRAKITMSTSTVIAVVQGDIVAGGQVQYYEKPFLQESLKFSRTDAKGESHELRPYKKYPKEVEKLLEAIAPTLGGNLQYFVFHDQQPTGERILDPYLPGQLKVELKRKNGQKLSTTLELPLNSLYVPRRCPNGKPAHVSWKFCPWTGKKLPQ